MRYVAPLYLLLLLLLASRLPGAVVRSFERSFSEQELSAGRLTVALFSGKITVLSCEKPGLQVTVNAELDTEDEVEAERLLKELTLLMDSRDGVVQVLASYARSVHWDFENWPPVRLSVVVLAPQRLDLELKTEDGNIDVARMAGAMKARSGSGLVYFRGVDGSVDAETESGDIVLAHCTGDARLHSLHGSIKAGPVGGLAEMKGHGGDIEIDAAGRGLRAESVGADLTVAFRSPVSGPSSLKVSGGSINLSLDRKAVCSLDLKASLFGKVVLTREGVLPLSIQAGSFGRRRVKAELNGGGPLVEAQAEGGSIVLQPEVGE